MSDVKAKYHQVTVAPQLKDLLRFLWWENGDIDKPNEVYRMKSHLFIGIKRPAIDNEDMYDGEIAYVIVNNFYVDDLLHSESSEKESILVAQQIQECLTRGDFKLNKWMSNSKKILATFPKVYQAKSVQNMDISSSALSTERAFGLSCRDGCGCRMTVTDANARFH